MLHIHKITVYLEGFGSVNNYVIENTEDKEVILIDVSDNLDNYEQLFREKQWKAKSIFLTHLHYDHMTGLAEFKNKYPEVPLYVSQTEKDLYQDEKYNFSHMFQDAQSHLIPQAQYYFSDNDDFNWGEDQIQIIEIKGHSYGSLCFYCAQSGWLISGDTLFYHSIGIQTYDLDKKLLVSDIKDRLLILPGTTLVYPGHGKSTTISEERINNPYITSY